MILYMNFASSIFVFIFMPLFLTIYLILNMLLPHNHFIKKRFLDIIVIFVGFVFYMWACFDNIFFLLELIIITYLLAIVINRTKRSSVKEIIKEGICTLSKLSFALVVLICSIITSVIILYRFKYEGKVNFPMLNMKNMSMPLGISFLIFSVISYLVDVYKGAETGKLIDVALYISFFPKVISGPIVLWDDFYDLLGKRKITVARVEQGILKIIYGLSKKIIFADYFGTVVSKIQTNSIGGGIDKPTGWLICILYMQQIYFDFAGYSDVAIGLSKIIGLDFKENFYFPYVSTSITEFWKRWHISLGLWFRKYIYIPMGGNRKGKKRTVLNSFIVMVISGIWHGAGFGYLLWGIVHGLCMVGEKLSADKTWYKKIPRIIKWFFTMFVVMLGWQIFRLGSLSATLDFFKVLVGINSNKEITYTYQYYLSTKVVVMLAISIMGSTVLGRVLSSPLYQKYQDATVWVIMKYVLSLLLFAVVLVCVVNSTYSPFIYFQY